MTPYKTYITLAAIFTLFTGITLAVNPVFADFLFEEYGVMELFGVAIAAVTMVLGFLLCFRGLAGKSVWRFWALLAFLSFLFIGENLSWGEKIFNLRMPVIAGIKFDALHDAFSVSIGAIKKTRDFIIETGLLDPKSIAIMLTLIIIGGALCYFAAGAIRKYKKDITRFFKINLKKAPFLFLFIALVLIFAALIIDDDNLVKFPHKEVADEGLELLGVLAMFFCALCGLIGRKWGRKWGFANKGEV